MRMNNKIYRNPLFVFAMEAEAGDQFNNCNKLFTGLGKINAAYELMKYLGKNTPDIVINLGTAGSNVFRKGEVVCCSKFVQRDMNVGELGFKKYETPFSDEGVILSYGLETNELQTGICGTGDSFETGHQNGIYNVVDMESYALAMVCKRQKIPFLCLKYISDGADEEAAADWNTEIKNAAQKLKQTIEKFTQI